MPPLLVHGKRNQHRAHLRRAQPQPYVKDSINDYIVHGKQEAVNPEKKGTKAAAVYRLTVKPGECQVIRLRLSDRTTPAGEIDRQPFRQ